MDSRPLEISQMTGRFFTDIPEDSEQWEWWTADTLTLEGSVARHRSSLEGITRVSSLPSFITVI